jgi:hypothetical protein
MSMTVPVSLTVVRPGPFFDNLPGQMSFFMKTGGIAPAQVMQIRNAGSGTLDWTLAKSTADGGNWLDVSAVSGTAPSGVVVRVVRANLPGDGRIPGTYAGQLILRSARGSVTVPVSVVVGANVFQQVNPLNFTKVFGGPNPLPQILTVASSGSPIRFSAEAATAKGGNWLQISKQGQGCCATPGVIAVSVNAGTLAAGTYTGQVTFTEYPSNTMSMTVPVTLTIERPGEKHFDSVPGQMSFFMKTGGSPRARGIQIRNGGSGVLNWTLGKSTADGGNWLTVSAVEGTAPSTVTVRIALEHLPGEGLIAGTFTGQLVFRTPGSIVTIPVSMVVGADVFRQVNAMTFTKAPGGANPVPKNLAVASTGATIRFSAVAANAKGGNWLQISKQGQGCCATPEQVTVSANAVSLPAGTYLGQITLTEYSGDTMAMTVPVTLRVTTAATAEDASESEEEEP